MPKFSFKTSYLTEGWPCEISIEAESYEDLKVSVGEVMSKLKAAGAEPHLNKPSGGSFTRKKKEPDYVTDPNTGELRCLHVIKGTTSTCNAVGVLADGDYGKWFKCPNYKNHQDFKPKAGG